MALYLMVAADFNITGGMDRANYWMADYLARRGHEVHLVGHTAAESLRRHAAVHWHAVRRPGGHDALGWMALNRSGKRWARRVAARGGRVIVNGGNCCWADVNWVHYVHAAYASRVAGNSAQRLWQGWKNGKAQRDEARALARARVVIANSEATRNALHSRLGIPEERLHRIYYGCEAEFRPVSAGERSRARQELGWEGERTKLLFVGALGDRRKGFDTLFAAWQQLREAGGWEMDLAVVGRGSELASWQRRARAAGMGSNCEFLGYREDMPRLLAAADGMVAPTRYEAYGLGVQEALACGLPAIVSAEAGVAERFPAALRPLLLHDPESVGELVERLAWWQGHRREMPEALTGVSDAIRSRGWDTMAEEIVAVMDEAQH